MDRTGVAVRHEPTQSDAVAVATHWKPKWMLSDPDIGLTVDDDCFVVLVNDGQGHWYPTTHTPLKMTRAVSDTISRYMADSNER